MQSPRPYFGASDPVDPGSSWGYAFLTLPQGNGPPPHWEPLPQGNVQSLSQVKCATLAIVLDLWVKFRGLPAL